MLRGAGFACRTWPAQLVRPLPGLRPRPQQRWLRRRPGRLLLASVGEALPLQHPIAQAALEAATVATAVPASVFLGQPWPCRSPAVSSPRHAPLLVQALPLLPCRHRAVAAPRRPRRVVAARRPHRVAAGVAAPLRRQERHGGRQRRHLGCRSLVVSRRLQWCEAHLAPAGKQPLPRSVQRPEPPHRLPGRSGPEPRHRLPGRSGPELRHRLPGRSGLEPRHRALLLVALRDQAPLATDGLAHGARRSRPLQRWSRAQALASSRATRLLQPPHRLDAARWPVFLLRHPLHPPL